MNLPLSAPKAAGLLDRTEPLARTEAMLSELCAAYGITRVGETTLLDRTGIPTYCAIVPNSPDIIGVYNGKGRTRQAARVSAVMEAVERQVATDPRVDTKMVALSEVLRAIDLTPLELLHTSGDVECARATDLLSGRELWIPMALVQFPWPKEKRITKGLHTNGLASGNTPLEAIYHALSEMVERHVWSLYIVRSKILPRYFRGDDAQERALARTLVFPTGDAQIDQLHEEIVSSGLRVRVCMLEEPPFAPVALATVLEPFSDPPMAHVGLGASLSPAHAVERALTEAVQSRVVDVQAAREDIFRADDPMGMSHGKRITALPHNRWFIDLPAEAVRLEDLENCMSDDLARDTRTLLAQMRAAGIRTIAAVELSRDQRISVMRICAPDCETTAVDGRLGPIALSQLNPLAS